LNHDWTKYGKINQFVLATKKSSNFDYDLDKDKEFSTTDNDDDGDDDYTSHHKPA